MINFGKFNNLTKVSSNISTMQTFISTFGELWGAIFLHTDGGGGNSLWGEGIVEGGNDPEGHYVL